MNIPIVYFRSSSLGNWEFCQMQYFLQYVLGYKAPANKRAQLGTITHKSLEVLANCKKLLQEAHANKKKFEYFDKEIGLVEFTKSSLYTDKFVEDLTFTCFLYYSQKCIHDYIEKDFEFSYNLVKVALTRYNKLFDPRFRNIIEPEPFFDLPIDEPWAKMVINGEPVQLCIKGTIDLVTELDEDTIEVIDWKGLPLNTLLPTPNGFITMKEIQIGDSLYDQFGEICKVVGKSKIKTKECFKIIFDDKTEVICDDEHLWKLSNGKTVDIKNLKIGDKINVCKPIKCEDKKLPIDPYLLGVWLGDGRNRSCEITSSDKEIFDNLKNRGFEIGRNTEKRNNNIESRTILKQTNKFRKLNLLNNKHIPNIYFRASYQQRLDLLRGLMDTDGNVNRTRKQAVFTSCNKKLSDDVKHLLITLGQRPNQSVIERNTNFKKDVIVYPIAFRPININPFSLSRKKIDENWGSGNSNIRRIINIEKSIIQKTQCISVDSKDNTYLCTENYIPTHNTGQRKDWATGEVKDYHKLMKDTQLLLYNYAISKLFPKYKNRILTIIFLRDGGPFSLCFDESDEKEFLSRLKKKFYEIGNTKYPKLCSPTRSSFKCTKLCHFYKEKFPGSEKSICEHVTDGIKTYGIKLAQEKLRAEGFDQSNYSAPGEGN